MTATPQLTPPPGPPPDSHARGNPGRKLVAVLLVAVLAVLALGVVVVLPERVAQTEPAAPGKEQRLPRETLAATSAQSAESTVPAKDPSTLPDAASATSRPQVRTRTATATATETEEATAGERAKAAAETALRKVLQHQVRLENAGVAVWGVEKVRTSYAQAQAVLAAADGDFEAARYGEARARYDEAARHFKMLEESRPERLQASLAKGHAALAAGDATLAASAFELALALDPGNAEATTNLERARQRPNALAALERGRALEAQGKLPAAQQAYESAIAIEAEFAPARIAVQRVAQQIRLRKFNAAMGEAIVALDAGRFDVARRALASARNIEPGSRQVAEVAQRLGEAIRLAKLNRLRESAARLEEQERWSEALKAHDAALQLDDTASFAVNGRVRAENFAELHRQLERYLSNPERLQSAAPLARAQKLLTAAERIDKVGPRLLQQRAKLAALIEVAQQPVEVVLRSDGQTEITILRVQRLGVFDQRILQLRPGAYTALGTRSGYRDVRVRVEVSPSAPSAPVDIRCVETI